MSYFVVVGWLVCVYHTTTTDLLDVLNHVQAHLHGTLGVVWSGGGQATDAVVAVAQQLDPMAVVLLRESMKGIRKKKKKNKNK